MKKKTGGYLSGRGKRRAILRAVKALSRGMLCLLLFFALFMQTGAFCRADGDGNGGAAGEDPAAEEAGAGGEARTIVDPLSSEERYFAVLYDNTNGLPTSEANDIAETEEGFIWIGSYSGLIRYDGDNFERMDSTGGITSIKCLFVDSRNRLWIGTNESGVAVMENGVIQRWSKSDGLKGTSVRSITEDGDGVIYVGTTSGVSAIFPDGAIRSISASAITNAFVEDLFYSTDGLIYGVTNAGDIFTLKGRQLMSFYPHEENFANCIFPDPDAPGMVYLERKEGGVLYGSLKDGFGKMKSIDISPLSQVESFNLIDGRIWICARNGIGVLDGETFYDMTHLPLNNSVGNVMTDYEGNLWFTSTRQGVMKLAANRFTDISDRYGLPEEVVNSTCMREDRLFIGTDTGLTVLGQNGPLTNLPIRRAVTASGTDMGETDLLEMLKGCRIRSVIRDSQDRLWISCWRKYGLLRYDGQEVTAFTPEDGLLSDSVRTVWECKDGSFIAAVSGGINVIRDDRIEASYAADSGLSNQEILCATEGLNGDIVCGSDGDGIYVIRDYDTVHIGTEAGLTSGAVMRIKYDPARHVFWIVTGNSLALMSEDYHITTIDSFPYSNNFDLYENSRGEMWVISSNGIYIVPADKLLAEEGIEPLHYGMSDGLPCIATANSYCELTEDGDLYIAGNTGVAKVNIEEEPERVTDLKAAVPYVDADGVRMYPGEDGSFLLNPRVRKLTIYGFVYNYSLINPQISYRLEGFDDSYVTVSRSELVPVDYTNLRGGTYYFEMKIKDPISRHEKMVSIKIVKQKAFYEYARFYVLAVLLLASAIAICVEQYIHRRMRQLEEKNREEAEKERINSELRMANQIQAGVLPSDFPAFPDRSEFDIYASMDPAKEVGGDFYDFFLIDDDHLCMLIADVSGKGVPASLFMMVNKTILKNTALLGRTPGEILTRTNSLVCEDNKMEMFVTVWLGILEISTGRLVAANAGHEYPVLMRSGEAFALYKDKHGFVLGGMEGIKYKEYSLTLSPGDKLFLYTDGVPEATNSEQQLFGTDRMLEALNEEKDASPEKLLKNVRAAVDGFVREAEQFDDLTMLCLEYRG